MEIDLLIRAAWVVPVIPEKTVIENGFIAIKDGYIVSVGEYDDTAKSKYSALQEKNLSTHVLLPGFINAHTHSAMNLFRGLADDLPLMEWLGEHIWPAEAKFVDESFVRDGSQLALAEMLRSGTTCFNDMYFYPDQTADVAIEAGMRACVGLILIDFPTAWASSPDEYLQKAEIVHDKYKQQTLIHMAFAPHAPYTVSDEPLNRMNILAEELDIPIHMHIHETRDEVEKAVEQYGVRPIKRLEDLGLLSQRLLAVHMTHLNEEEIQSISDYKVHVIHCPESNMKLASGICPVFLLQDAGVNIAIGTDSVASNNDLDMIGEMKTAALLAKVESYDSSIVSAYDALSMATINGARALGIQDKTGSLETGKSADVIAIDLDRIETTPQYDPVSQIVYSSNRNHVTDVWVAGRHLLDNRELTTMDYWELMDKAKSWQNKICTK